MARLSPAGFLKVVGQVYTQNPFPGYRPVQMVHTDIFNSKKKYKMYRIYTFDQRNIRVYVEFLNGFVRVYVEGADTGVGSWTGEVLGNFALGVKAAHEILVVSEKKGANQQ